MYEVTVLDEATMLLRVEGDGRWQDGRSDDCSLGSLSAMAQRWERALQTLACASAIGEDSVLSDDTGSCSGGSTDFFGIRLAGCLEGCGVPTGIKHSPSGSDFVPEVVL
jgi:hypothetical protein